MTTLPVTLKRSQRDKSNNLHVFFFAFISMRLSKSYVHGHEVNGLTWVDTYIFFSLLFFLIIFFHFCP